LGKKLYLHVGPGKTGTTAIQKFLHDNRDTLKRTGVLYPDLKHPSFPGPKDSFKIASHLLAWKNGFGDLSNIEEAQKIENEWFSRQINKKFLKVVFSSEYFTGRVTCKKILDLKEYIKQYEYDEVKIIYYFRRPDLYLESIYQQSVKNHGVYSNVFEQRHKIDQIYNIFELYAHYFGPENMIVRVYERDQFSQGNIFSDFIQAIDEDWSNDFVLPHKKDSNVGWHRNLIQIMRLVNENITDQAERDSFRRLLTELFRKLYSADKQAYNLLTLSQRHQIESIYKEKNTAIAKDYLGRVDGILFYESIAASQSTDSNLCLSAADAREIISYLRKKKGSLSALFKNTVEKAMTSKDKEIHSTAQPLFQCFQDLSG